MCGIGGVVVRHMGSDSLRECLDSMCAAMQRRGPDGHGSWVEPGGRGDWRVGLAHTRLSIQDVSEAGAQPMFSPSGAWAISFNGEIYNFRALREELKAAGVVFSGHSDTEVLVAALDLWGLERTLQRVDGMFALAAVHRRDRRLYLARDRAGEKPLYFGHAGPHFIFASTLRPLEGLPFWKGQLSAEAVALFLRYRYIPAPHSIYDNISKLHPGHIAVLDLDAAGQPPSVYPYWALNPNDAGASTASLEQAADELDAVLSDVVSEQLISDRALGAFLSGGVDSSLVTAVMCEQASARVKTFTVAFEEPEYNEAADARAIASYLGTDHTEVVLPVASGLALIPELCRIYDEPFADASQLPTLMVAKAARDEVVVALSGDGGDESFAGYGRYARCLSQWRDLERIPRVLRGGIGGVARAAEWGPVESAATSIMRRLQRGQGRRAGSVFRRWAQEYEARNILDLYHYELVMNRDATPTKPVNNAWLDTSSVAGKHSDLRSMMAFDLANYLPDDVLVKVDRATMHYSLESRAPLLDRRIVEYAWRLPDEQLSDVSGRGKLLLRRLLDRKVPKALTDRPKRGFAVPMRDWLRDEMRDWAEALLTPDRLAHSGLLDVPTLRHRWQQHLDGVWDNSSLIWTVLQLQSWLDRPS